MAYFGLPLLLVAPERVWRWRDRSGGGVGAALTVLFDFRLRQFRFNFRCQHGAAGGFYGLFLHWHGDRLDLFDFLRATSSTGSVQPL
jgi:hypothetical protein